MPKIIVIGHLLLKYCRKCSHMFFGGHSVYITLIFMSVSPLVVYNHSIDYDQLTHM